MASEKEYEFDATVVILTYNGEQHLEEILNAVHAQRYGGTFETLVIDSGSTDSTLDIIAKNPWVRLHQIPNSEFGHGKTRNLGAHLAKGRYVVYLTHDATPASDRWLHEITAPFDISERIVAVMGSQVPRADAFPLLRYDVKNTFASFGPMHGTTLFYDDDFIQDEGVRNAVTFYSDVNSAARRSVLTGEIPYRDVSYAEDQLLGRDVIDAGYIKAYAPRAVVWHSNEMTILEYDDRMFEETQGLREVGIDVALPSIPTVIKLVVGGVLRDAVRLVRDREVTTKRKLHGLLVNPAYHVQRWRGVRRGVRSALKRYGE
ncbi:Poly-beta-1%2C6-N-acetyl-D-glucosamine synthase [Chlamydia trachomatis]|uniref:glycosyltransferase family 2 protein n=1 Tax=Schaalia turicensis TaxID=131111 RepID=UPI00061D654D|nr:glycosyltransferase family A protein [Schaalia turicensis]CRH63507.1 Poly-beta-1%2C6-N-acetyl-D-glucosamine synthase [Chlamydia trachomatis]CRH87419.1 Poly-beta-1%2C6-N-acetyl-D-glucosamine synthase [Chlamydia trachomatis]